MVDQANTTTNITMKKYILLVLSVSSLLLTFAFAVPTLMGGNHEVRVLHPDLVYTVDPADDYAREVTCTSETFHLLFGEVQAHARVRRANLPDGFKPGDTFVVTGGQPLRDSGELKYKLLKTM